MRTRKKLSEPYLVALLLAGAVLAVYWPAANYPFLQYDDVELITGNPHVRAGLTREGIVWAFTTVSGVSFWHPLTWLSHMLDVELFGLDPLGHHAVALLFHTVNTLLLFIVLLRMTGAVWRSGFVAALFAIHPLHVESVAWIAERKDVLSAFFCFLALWAYLRYAERPGIPRFVPVVFLFALSLMAKPMLVTLPFVLLLLDFWPLGRLEPPGVTPPAAGGRFSAASPHRLVMEKIPLLILAVVSSVLTVLPQQKGAWIGSLGSFPLWVRGANTLVAYASYIGKTVWPASLAVFYPHPGDTLPAWQVAGAGVFIAVATVLVILQATRRPYLAVGWFWYLVTLVPVIGLVQVSGQAMADHFTYIPLVGLGIMIAWGVADAMERWPRRRFLPGVSALAALLALAVVAWFQVSHWRSSEALFRHAIEVTRKNWLAHNSLGFVLQGQGNIEEAMIHYREALRIAPNYAFAHNNLGLALLETGRPEEAAGHFREALRIKPDLAKAHSNLGVVFLRGGKIDEAIAEFRMAVRYNPEEEMAYNNLAAAYSKQGRLDEAVALLLEAVRIRPFFALGRLNLANALAQQGRMDKAVFHYRKVLETKPDDVMVRNRLGEALRNLEAASRPPK